MTIESDAINIADYSLIARIDANQRIPGNGSHVYCRNQSCCVLLNQSNCYSKGRIEYIGFRYTEPQSGKIIEILSIYRSPQSEIHQFTSDISKVLSNFPGISIIVGDFNVNLLREPDNSTLMRFMYTQCYHSMLNNTITTDYLSQLDFVFAKLEWKLYTNAYESYFSDHKPIFIFFNNNASNHCIDSLDSYSSKVCENIKNDGRDNAMDVDTITNISSIKDTVVSVPDLSIEQVITSTPQGSNPIGANMNTFVNEMRRLLAESINMRTTPI